MQAPRFECLSLDPLSLLWNGFVTPEIDISVCYVGDDFVITLIVVMIDEDFDLDLRIACRK